MPGQITFSIDFDPSRHSNQLVRGSPSGSPAAEAPDAGRPIDPTDAIHSRLVTRERLQCDKRP